MVKPLLFVKEKGFAERKANIIGSIGIYNETYTS